MMINLTVTLNRSGYPSTRKKQKGKKTVQGGCQKSAITIKELQFAS